MGDEEQDRLLPIANVGRLMKKILPPSTKISKESKQRIQEYATEFISFVTSEASQKCRSENRKTLNGDDICSALSSLGFDNCASSMARYLCKYREAEAQKAREQILNSQEGHEEDDESNPRIHSAGKQQPETSTMLRLSGPS